jgi:penicillin-insensitive murein endopeptidase
VLAVYARAIAGIAVAISLAACVEEPAPMAPVAPSNLAVAAASTSAPLERDAAPPDASPVDEHAAVEDEGDDDEHASDAPAMQRRAHAHSPALALDDAAFADALKRDAASLGPMSIGRPNAGILVGGVQMPEGTGWRMVDPGHAWGTQETVDAIARAVERVRAKFPGTPSIAIGHISAKGGGPLSPHKSHQAGRDVDIGFYYTSNAPWFARATPQNLDKARTWELVKAFADEDVEWIFLDTGVQRMLRDYALSHGEDHELVDRLVQVGSTQRRTVVHHVPGHATHLHVRFSSPIACELGARAAPLYRAELERVALAAKSRAATSGASRSKTAAAADKQPTNYFEHRVHAGDTLYRLAARYGVTVTAIQQANGLKGFALKPKMVLRIPKP